MSRFLDVAANGLKPIVEQGQQGKQQRPHHSWGRELLAEICATNACGTNACV